MSAPEGSGELKRPFDVSRLEPNSPEILRVEATPEECAAIADIYRCRIVSRVVANKQGR